MKATVMRPVEVEVTHIRLDLAIRYGDEEMPYDFPFRHNDMWTAIVNIDTGEIEDWPEGHAAKLHLKVVDCGTYTLLCDQEAVARKESDYVPHGVVPGQYGDYVILHIDDAGRITNWPRNPDISAFFPEPTE